MLTCLRGCSLPARRRRAVAVQAPLRRTRLTGMALPGHTSHADGFLETPAVRTTRLTGVALPGRRRASALGEPPAGSASHRTRLTGIALPGHTSKEP